MERTYTKTNPMKCLNAFHLKLFAAAFMLCDHIWGTLIPGSSVLLNCIGRLAFPIFAFQIAEGYEKTHNFKKYLLRMFLFALVSEIPYNLMVSDSLIDPFGQNVMFTFCIALLFLRLMDKAKEKGTLAYVLTVAFSFLGGFILGTVTFSDYYGYGVLTVFVFYLFRHTKFAFIGQLVGMVLIHWVMLEGRTLPILGFDVPVQAFAILSLIIIWMYNGKQGPHGKPVQYGFYAFYPVHMLILSVIRYFIIR